ncbi:methyl-accepting chemotaxis protein [Ancylobacter sp. 6x-1]|uniref:Methyl-accepting chemotaxis protein n=1 Tax=Ancylobacter crimeensis TaxID=2579147 RepID=A0ABT0D902_9HYPH|nr:methyl-accepting chemotaxis protein [Ancylobacter crimeensis]MCK0196422.1 methyl-accepting chemotaxis protein [Ancylobacter crimeensis]
MPDISIRQRIVFSFLAVLVVLSAMAGLTYYWLQQTEREALTVETAAVPALTYGLRMTTEWEETRSLLRDLSVAELADRAQIIEAILANRAQIRDLMNSYADTLDTDEENRAREKLAAVVDPYIAAADALFARARAGASEGEMRAIIERQLDPQLDAIRNLLTTAVTGHQAYSDGSTQRIVALVRSAEIALGTGFLLALVLAVVAGIWLFRAITIPLGRLLHMAELMRAGDFRERLSVPHRDEFATLGDGVNAMSDELTALIGQIQKSGIQVNTSITEIAATSKEQQATASEIAATTTEIGATAKEISATSSELVRTMGEVSAVADQTATLAGGGQAGLARMEATMRHVMEAAGAINAKLAVLSEKAGNINQVVTTITKVADQTNLLSLNAAIEAEKAGQYGRGFAVVATEIRRLADQTAVSTYDIEQMVKDIQSAVAAGVMGMDKFSEEVRRGMVEVQQVGGQLSDIIQQVQGLVPRFEIANEGMQAQATGAAQISDALSQLSEAAQQTVESLQQSTRAIDELNQVSGNLRNSIVKFRLRSA